MVRISRSRIDVGNGRVDNAVLRDYGETLVGGSSAATADQGYHLHFDGSSDTIDVAASTSLNSDNISISFWIKPDQWRIQGILDKTNFSNSWRVFMNSASGTIEFDALSDANNVSSSAAAPVGEWTHVAISYDKSITTAIIYINGTSSGTNASFANAGNDQNNAIRIAPSASTRFDGAIDDIRIFNKALTSGEVTALYGYREGSLTATPMVAHWRFDEGGGSSVFDTSGKNNTGTITGSPTWVAGSAAFGKRMLNLGYDDEGLFFDGLTDYVNTGTNAAVSALTNNFTVMAWIRPVNLTGTAAKRILGHARANSINGFAFGISTASSNNLLLTTLGVRDYTPSSAVVTEGVWQHVAAVLDSSNDVTYYIDGVTMQTVTHTNPGNADTNDDFYIGAVSASSSTVISELFSGAIRDVRVYDTALSGANIASIYNGTHIATNLIGHWPLTETSGNTAEDTSASGNDGTLIGKPIWLGGESGSVFNFTLTNDCDFYFANPADSSTATSFTLILRQDSVGGHGITWPTEVVWPGGTVPTPTTTAGRMDVFAFTTINGGAAWLGAHAVSDLSEQIPVTASFRASYTSTSDLTTYSFTSSDIGVASADRIVLVSVHTAGGNDNTRISSATIAGITATHPDGADIGRNAEGAFIYAAVPTGTTGTISVTMGAGKLRCVINVWAIYGASSTHSDVDEATSESSSTNISLSALTIPANGMGFFSVVHPNTSTTGWSWTNAIERSDNTYEDNSRYSTADTSTAGTPTVTATTTANVNERTIVGIAFGPST